MSIITGYMAAGMIIDDEAARARQARNFQVRAYDEDGDTISHLPGIGQLSNALFLNEDEVRQKLTGAVTEYNKVAIYPVTKLEVYYVQKVASANIENCPGIGEFTRA